MLKRRGVVQKRKEEKRERGRNRKDVSMAEWLSVSSHFNKLCFQVSIEYGHQLQKVAVNPTQDENITRMIHT